MSSTTKETFSAPAEEHTFDGLLSDFDGTIVDSTDGMAQLFNRRVTTNADALTIRNSNRETLAPVSHDIQRNIHFTGTLSDPNQELAPNWGLTPRPSSPPPMAGEVSM